MELLNLFIIFFRIGALTFGGGYAMIPLLMRETVDKRGWLTAEEFADVTAIGQVTPGIIAVNLSTYVGYKRRRLIGGIAATLGIIMPAMIIITVIAAFLRSYADNVYVAHAFAGIRAVVCVLVFKAVVTIGKTAVKGSVSIAIFIGALAVMLLSDALSIGIPAICIALAAAAIGVVLSITRVKK